MAEATLHKAVVKLLRLAAHKDVIWYHVPNGEKRSAVTGARLKALGVIAGVADLAFVISFGRAAFLELKAPNGRRSQGQLDFADACERAGALYRVVDNIGDVIRVLCEWGVIRSTITPATAGREGRGAQAVKSASRRRVPLNTRASGASA